MMSSPLLNKLFKVSKNGICMECDRDEDGALPALTYAEPDYWHYRDTDDASNYLDTDFCKVRLDGEYHYFIRVVLAIPIIDSSDTLQWGVWVSQKKENFDNYKAVFKNSRRPVGEPYFGWFSNGVDVYPDTLGLKTTVNFQEDGLRPLIQLDHDNDHPLCQDQHDGITNERAHEIIHMVLRHD